MTLFPGQKGFVDATMETPAGTLLFWIMVMVFDVAGFPVGQAMSEVIIHDTMSPDAGI